MATLDIYIMTQKIRILLLNLCNYAAVLNIFFSFSLFQNHSTHGDPQMCMINDKSILKYEFLRFRSSAIEISILLGCH